MRLAPVILPCLFVLLVPAARADTVKLKNGDTLTGTVVSVLDGKLTLKTAAAGDVVIDVAQVDSFATDASAKLAVKRAGGEPEVVEGKVALASGGSVSVQAAGGARSVAIADLESVNKPEFHPTWEGSVAGSSIWTRGNSVTQSTTLDANVIRRGLDDRITLTGWYRASRSRDETTKVTSTTQRRAGASGKYDWFLSKKVYAYGMISGERDAIANVDLRFTAGAGAGWQVIEEDNAKFNVEGGVNYFSEDYSDSTPKSEHAAARVAYHYDRKLTETYATSFFNDTEAYKVFGAPRDYLAHTKGGFRENLTESFFATQWVEFYWDTTPAAGKKRQDVTYAFGIGWSF